jgi:hypothetical protein
MTQASQAGGGRSTANINKNTDQLGGLALTRRPIRRETSPNTSKSSPTTLPNMAAKQRNESKRSPECEGSRSRSPSRISRWRLWLSPRPLVSCLAPSCGSHKSAVVGGRECLCSRTDRDAVVACLVPGPQMHASPRLQQGLRESKLRGHWVPFEGQASVNQQTIAASDLPRRPRKLLR